MDVTLIPVYNRPEFLDLCLERIEQSEIPEGMVFVFQVDYGHDPKCIEVIQNRLKGQLKAIYKTDKSKFPTKSKLSYNILTGYRNAVMRSERYVFMIEDDVMIGKDFYQWHIEVQWDNELFCSIGSKNPNREVDKVEDPAKYYTSSGDYASVGVCYHKDVLKELVLVHANEKYFTTPARYIKNHIGMHGISAMYPEQAGLIRRLQIKSGLPIAFPYVPRAFHSGFYGKNRKGYEIVGTFEERRDKVREIAFDLEKLKQTVKPRWVRDSEPCDLDGYFVTTIFDKHYKN